MITISLCMIVKNEENTLERCLTPLKKIVDEMIIVDTGSTDKTKEIAKKFTDRIYDFTWTGNFADARNFSFSKAKMDYIYCADADEVIDEENVQKFILLKKGMLPEIEIVQMYYCNQLSFNTIYNYDKELRPKLYKRLREFHWINPIHEAVRLDPVIYDSEIEIIHKPESCHTSRDLAAFYKMHQDGIDFSAKLHNLYAKELYISGEPEDFIKAIPFFEGTACDPAREKEQIMEAFCVLAHAYRLKKDTPQFFKYALKNVVSESCSEICYEIGCYYESIDDLEEAAIWFYNAVFETTPILNIHHGGDCALDKLTNIYQVLGHDGLAKDYARQSTIWRNEH